MARRATIIEEKRAADVPFLLVDTGNFVRGKSADSMLKAEYLAKAMALMGYDAINMGREEIILGAEEILDLRDRARLPLISSNLLWQGDQRPVVTPYIIKRVGASQFLGFQYGGIKVGLVGLAMGSDADPMRRLIPREMQVSDAITTLSPTIQKLRQHSHVVIVLSDLSLDDAKKVAQQVPGIDLFFIGSGAGAKHVEELDGTIFVRPARKGDELGDVQLVLDEKKKVVSSSIEWTLLDETIGDSPEMVELVKEYKKAQEDLRKTPPQIMKK